MYCEEDNIANGDTDTIANDNITAKQFIKVNTNTIANAYNNANCIIIGNGDITNQWIKRIFSHNDILKVHESLTIR